MTWNPGPAARPVLVSAILAMAMAFASGASVPSLAAESQRDLYFKAVNPDGTVNCTPYCTIGSDLCCD
ncbi:MAG: hypothetical protein AB7V46_23715 [Thermomicrobiales bacterium]